MKLHATSNVLNSVLICPPFDFFFQKYRKIIIEYPLGRLWGFALSSQVSAKIHTAPKITYSPAILKNAMNIPGMVCPNNTTTKFENEITANAVKMYVFQSNIF